MLAGGSEGLKSFLYWFEIVKEAGNQTILELYLWKFFVYLPDITRRIVLSKFRRDGLTWEIEQIEAAARFRQKPSKGELSSPPAKHSRWVSAARTNPDEEIRRRMRFSRDRIILLPLVALAGLSVVGVTSLFQGARVWTRLLERLTEFYKDMIREPLQAIVALVYPMWADLPAWAYDVAVLLACFYLCFLTLDLLGKREIVLVADVWGVGAEHESGLHGIFRHCFAFFVSPLLLIAFVAAYFHLVKNYKRRVSDFHINNFKVQLVSNGISLTGFDDAIETEDIARRGEVELRTGRSAILRAIILYLSPFLTLLIVICFAFPILLRG